MLLRGRCQHCPGGFHLCARLVLHAYRLGTEEDTACLSANVQLFLRYIGNAFVLRQPPQNGHTTSGIPQLTRTGQQHPCIIACLLYHVRHNNHAELVCRCFFLQHIKCPAHYITICRCIPLQKAPERVDDNQCRTQFINKFKQACSNNKLFLLLLPVPAGSDVKHPARIRPCSNQARSQRHTGVILARKHQNVPLCNCSVREEHCGASGRHGSRHIRHEYALAHTAGTCYDRHGTHREVSFNKPLGVYRLHISQTRDHASMVDRRR